jgi:hypothetical protein
MPVIPVTWDEDKGELQLKASLRKKVRTPNLEE